MVHQKKKKRNEKTKRTQIKLIREKSWLLVGWCRVLNGVQGKNTAATTNEIILANSWGWWMGVGRAEVLSMTLWPWKNER